MINKLCGNASDYICICICILNKKKEADKLPSIVTNHEHDTCYELVLNVNVPWDIEFVYICGNSHVIWLLWLLYLSISTFPGSSLPFSPLLCPASFPFRSPQIP